VPLLYKTKPDMNRDIQFTTEGRDYQVSGKGHKEAPPIASFRLKKNQKTYYPSTQKAAERSHATLSSADVLFDEANRPISTEEKVFTT
jgi:hypothetical protein